MMDTVAEDGKTKETVMLSADKIPMWLATGEDRSGRDHASFGQT